MSVVDLELWFRAGALCLAAEPHRGGGPWPCSKCLREAARQLSKSAAIPSGAAPRIRSEGIAGGSGRLGPPPCQAGASTSQTEATA